MRIGLSKRKHLPCIYAAGSDHALPLWKIKQALEMEKTGLQLDGLSYYVLTHEIKDYLPPFSLENKTVLDVGASHGEVAYYYRTKLKAKKVICIEASKQRLPQLYYNAKKIGNIDVIPEFFNIEHLAKYRYDFIKMDIEGHEAQLLDILKQGYKLKPTILEVHSRYLRDQFKQYGFYVTSQSGHQDLATIGLYMMSNC